MSQILSTRHLGPAFHSSLQPLRLGSTVFGAWIALAEPPRSILTWFGLFGIIAISTFYVRAQQAKAPTYTPLKDAKEQSEQEPFGVDIDSADIKTESQD